MNCKITVFKITDTVLIINENMITCVINVRISPNKLAKEKDWPVNIYDQHLVRVPYPMRRNTRSGQIFSLPAKKTNMLVSPSPGNWVSQKPYRLSRAVEAVSPEKYKAWRAAPSVVIDVTQNIKAERAPVVQYVCKKILNSRRIALTKRWLK